MQLSNSKTITLFVGYNFQKGHSALVSEFHLSGPTSVSLTNLDFGLNYISFSCKVAITEKF